MIPGYASWTTLPSPVSDEDRIKGNKFLTEIREKYNTIIESDDEDPKNSFEDKDPLQTSFQPKLQKTFIFKPKIKNLSRRNENQFAEDTYPCFPMTQNEPSPDKNLIHDDQNQNKINSINNHENSISSNFKFSCIRLSKQKLFMRDDNPMLFIPPDCKITTETGQELIDKNRLKYEHLRKKIPKTCK